VADWANILTSIPHHAYRLCGRFFLSGTLAFWAYLIMWNRRSGNTVCHKEQKETTLKTSLSFAHRTASSPAYAAESLINFNVDPTLVLAAFVLGLLFVGGTFWAYIILMIVIPEEPSNNNLVTGLKIYW
jgi:hypothetical protein